MHNRVALFRRACTGDLDRPSSNLRRVRANLSYLRNPCAGAEALILSCGFNAALKGRSSTVVHNRVALFRRACTGDLDRPSSNLRRVRTNLSYLRNPCAGAEALILSCGFNAALKGRSSTVVHTVAAFLPDSPLVLCSRDLSASGIPCLRLCGAGAAFTTWSALAMMSYFAFSAEARRPPGSDFSGRRSGKRITSRMVWESVRSMQRRSMPIPTPPAGGMP